MSLKFKGPKDVIDSVRKETKNRIRLKVLILGPGSEGGKRKVQCQTLKAENAFKRYAFILIASHMGSCHSLTAC